MKKEKAQGKIKKYIDRIISWDTFYFYAVVITFSFFLFPFVSAQNTTTNSTEGANQQQIQDKQQQVEDLKKKAESYRQMIEMKQNKAQTLQNQLELMESQISSLENDISHLQEEIDKTSTDIGLLVVQVEEKERIIKEQKKILAGLIQNYYENNQNSVTEIMLRGTSLSNFLSQTDYVSQTGSKVDELMTSVISIRDDLEQNKNDLEKKNDEQRER